MILKVAFQNGHWGHEVLAPKIKNSAQADIPGSAKFVANPSAIVVLRCVDQNKSAFSLFEPYHRLIHHISLPPSSFCSMV